MTTKSDKFVSWKEFYLSQNEGNHNIIAYNDAMHHSNSKKEILQNLVQEVDSVILLAGEDQQMTVVHSPKNFGGTRSRPTDKLVALKGMGKEATCIVLDEELLLRESKYRVPPQSEQEDILHSCGMKSDLRAPFFGESSDYIAFGAFIPAPFLRDVILVLDFHSKHDLVPLIMEEAIKFDADHKNDKLLSGKAIDHARHFACWHFGIQEGHILSTAISKNTMQDDELNRYSKERHIQHILINTGHQSISKWKQQGSIDMETKKKRKRNYGRDNTMSDAVHKWDNTINKQTTSMGQFSEEVGIPYNTFHKYGRDDDKEKRRTIRPLGRASICSEEFAIRFCRKYAPFPFVLKTIVEDMFNDNSNMKRKPEPLNKQQLKNYVNRTFRRRIDEYNKMTDKAGANIILSLKEGNEMRPMSSKSTAKYDNSHGAEKTSINPEKQNETPGGEMWAALPSDVNVFTEEVLSSPCWNNEKQKILTKAVSTEVNIITEEVLSSNCETSVKENTMSEGEMAQMVSSIDPVKVLSATYEMPDTATSAGINPDKFIAERLCAKVTTKELGLSSGSECAKGRMKEKDPKQFLSHVFPAEVRANPKGHQIGQVPLKATDDIDVTPSLNQSTTQSIESANKVSESVLSDDAMHENVMSSTCCISGSKLIAYALPDDSKNARERSNENLPDVASESTSPQKRQIPMYSTDDIDATASLIQSTTQSIESANIVSENVLSADVMHENVMSSTYGIAGIQLIAATLPDDSESALNSNNEKLPDVASKATSLQTRRIPVKSTDDIDATVSLNQSTTQSIKSEEKHPEKIMPLVLTTADVEVADRVKLDIVTDCNDFKVKAISQIIRNGCAGLIGDKVDSTCISDGDLDLASMLEKEGLEECKNVMDEDCLFRCLASVLDCNGKIQHQKVRKEVCDNITKRLQFYSKTFDYHKHRIFAMRKVSHVLQVQR